MKERFISAIQVIAMLTISVLGIAIVYRCEGKANSISTIVKPEVSIEDSVPNYQKTVEDNHEIGQITSTSNN